VEVKTNSAEYVEKFFSDRRPRADEEAGLKVAANTSVLLALGKLCYLNCLKKCLIDRFRQIARASSKIEKDSSAAGKPFKSKRVK